MEGCKCPQKSVYIILGLVFLLINLGVIIELNRRKMSIKKVLQSFILKIIVIILVYKLVEYLCNKKSNTIAWVIAILPFFTYVGFGMKFMSLLSPSNKMELNF